MGFSGRPGATRLGGGGGLVALVLSVSACGGQTPDAEAPPAAEAPAEGPQSVEGRHALETAEAVLAAINGPDPRLLRDVMMPDARIVATGRGAPRISTVDEMAALLADPPQAFDERMWDPRVRVSGGVADVWAPYDFYLDGTWSHCGIDAFHLVLVEGSWRVQSLVYTVAQPPECSPHPDGPPPGAADDPGASPPDNEEHGA